MKRRSGIMALALFVASVGASGASYRYPELRAVTERMEKGETVTVAFFGGSITFGATASDPLKTSWRALVTAGLEERFPKARVRSVDAAIGSQPSKLGVFRMDRDVLPYKPDLCFVEFAVNDWGDPDAGETFEGIVRKLRKTRSDMAIVPVYIGSNKAYDRSPAQDRHAAVAAHYGLPAADVYGAVRERMKEGLKTEVILTDGCHPNDAGYRLYAEIILAQLVRQAFETGTATPFPAGPLTSNRFESASMIELARLPDLGEWKMDTPSVVGTWFDQQPSRWHSSAVVPGRDGATLALETPCTGLGLYYELTEGGGPIALSADGVPVREFKTDQKLPFARVMYGFAFLDGGPKSRKIVLAAPQAARTRAAYLLVTK